MTFTSSACQKIRRQVDWFVFNPKKARLTAIALFESRNTAMRAESWQHSHSAGFQTGNDGLSGGQQQVGM